MVRVGSLGIRWVLMQHAEPWLLTVKSKQESQSHLTSESQHATSSRSKRCRRDPTDKKEEPPAKRTVEDKPKGEDKECVSSEVIREKLNQEEQMKNKDQGDEEKSLNFEGGGERRRPEEERGEGGTQIVGTKERQEKLPTGEHVMDAMDIEMEQSSPAATERADGDDE